MGLPPARGARFDPSGITRARLRRCGGKSVATFCVSFLAVLFVAPAFYNTVVLGVGDLPWTVASSTVSGSAGGINWLSASPANGTSTAGDPLPEVVAAVDTVGLAAGQYYGQVQVGAENTANSPQVVTVVLNLFEPGAAQAGPVVEPLGLFFVAPQGGEPAPAEEIEIANVSAAPITFTNVRIPEAGADPFGHAPAAGTIAPAATAAVSVERTRVLWLRGSIALLLSWRFRTVSFAQPSCYCW